MGLVPSEMSQRFRNHSLTVAALQRRKPLSRDGEGVVGLVNE